MGSFQYHIVKSIDGFKVVRKCDGSFLRQRHLCKMQEFGHGFREYFTSFSAYDLFLTIEMFLKFRIYIPINQFDGITVLIGHQLFLHIEYGHIVHQHLISSHCIYLVLLCFLQCIQVANTIQEEQCNKQNREKSSQDKIPIMLPKRRRFIQETGIGRTRGKRKPVTYQYFIINNRRPVCGDIARNMACLFVFQHIRNGLNQCRIITILIVSISTQHTFFSTCYIYHTQRKDRNGSSSYKLMRISG